MQIVQALTIVCILYAPVFCVAQIDPRADEEATVIVGNARFTILTPQLIRMEWSDAEKFEDNASLVFINRRLSVPKFSIHTDSGWTMIETDKLALHYKSDGKRFDAQNVSISFTLNGKQMEWHPRMKDTVNLGGTIRTLDGVEKAVPLEPGLLSRDGWVLVDDSRRPLFDNSDWQWVTPRSDTTAIDWYFFGYGHEYKQELYDFTQVAGKIPMPPRFAFGYWWSRYWAYTDAEFKQLVNEFEQHDVPIDVLVIDMDWHKTFNLRWENQPKDQAGQPLGWTGYTWDSTYFPDPPKFLQWCDDRGLKTPLNVHPASGIQPHEEHYPEMARAMGIDPATKKYIPFDIVDKKFATNYLDFIIRPLEKEGVDFWWLDWQQWGTTKIVGVTPTWWLNYVFFTDMERQGRARPLLFHRWGGLGNHRYEIGFSGDAISVWSALAFEPYFTATAANVGYGYWSHDIGGHMPGVVTPELYTRWIQFGIFSPILRTHTTKNPESERRIWAYPPEYFKIMRNAFLLRYAMIPYVYTMSRKTYDTGISICRPMYYDYPDTKEAYDFKDEYMFGDNMLVAPIATSIMPDSLLAKKTIWLPEGVWIEWFTGAQLRGPSVVERTFTIDEIPVYVRAGSIIPIQPKMKNSHEKPVDPLILTIFPGDSGSFKLYEDHGNSTGYQHGEFSTTSIRQSTDKNGTMRVEIEPTEGNYPGILSERSYEIRLFDQLPPKEIVANGRQITDWRYDGENLTTIILLPRYRTSERVEVRIVPSIPNSSELVDGFMGKSHRLRNAMNLINSQWSREWSPDALVAAVQTGNRISLHPEDTQRELEKLRNGYLPIVEQIKRLSIDPNVIRRCINHLSSFR